MPNPDAGLPRLVTDPWELVRERRRVRGDSEKSGLRGSTLFLPDTFALIAGLCGYENACAVAAEEEGTEDVQTRSP